jgi:hypothetical protein
VDWCVASVGDAASVSISKTIKTLDQFNICIFLLKTYKNGNHNSPQTNDEELCTQNRRRAGAVDLIRPHECQRDSKNGKERREEI